MGNFNSITRTLDPVRQFAREKLPIILRPFIFSMSRAVNGKRFQVPLIGGVGLVNQVGPEPWMTDLLKRLLLLTETRGFIDVGVNTGQTLLKLKSIEPELRYLGFEPNPFCVWYASRLVRANGFDNCDIYPVALSDSAGLLSFIAQTEADSAASMIEELRPDRKPFTRQYIATLVFDNLELDLDGISVVKIDVEGAELHVLLGMKRFVQRSRPCIICEVLHSHSDAMLADSRRRNDSIMRLLEEVNYSVYRLIKGQTRVERLEPVSRFPDEVWSARSLDACDYLMVPREQGATVVSAFRGTAIA